jgi:hypothetical protein
MELGVVAENLSRVGLWFGDAARSLSAFDENIY